MITSVGGLCEKPIELFDRLRKLDILQPSIGARSNPPTDDIRVPSEESAELAGFLVPSFDSEGRYKLVQSVGLWILSGTRNHLNGNPEAGANRLDEVIGFHGPPLSARASTKLIDIRQP
jgi:hypothetical protein